MFVQKKSKYLNFQITGAALLSYGAIIFSIISGLFYTPWMVRTIGSEQYALYTLAISVVNLFMIDFGISSAITKFLSMYYAKGQEKEAKTFIGIVYKIFVIITIFLAVVLLIYYIQIDQIYSNFTITEIRVFKNLYIIVSVFSVISFPFSVLNGILMANEKFIIVKVCNLGQKVLSVLLLILCLKIESSVYLLILVHIMTHSLFLMLKYYYVNGKMHIKANYNTWDKNIAKSLFSYSVWSTISNLAGRCIFNIMPTLIAIIVGTVEVTVFSFAATLEGYVYTFSDAINGLFMPRISKYLLKDNDQENFNNLLSLIARFHVYTIGLIYIGFICVGKEFVNIWLGAGYEKVYWCAILLILPSIVDVPQQVARSALLVKDIVKEQAFIQIIMAIVNITLCIILMPLYGILGSALAVCISYLIRTIGMNILYKINLKINVLQYFKKTYSKWIIVAGLTLYFGMHVKKVLMIDGIIRLCIVSIIIVTIYVLLVVLFNNPKNLLLKISGKVQSISKE